MADKKEGSPIVDTLYKWATVALWFVAGAIVVPAYVISNLYFEKWWKWRESL
jgi:hypothetical protein